MVSVILRLAAFRAHLADLETAIIAIPLFGCCRFLALSAKADDRSRLLQCGRLVLSAGCSGTDES
jgi:hypothetical protein